MANAVLSKDVVVVMAVLLCCSEMVAVAQDILTATCTIEKNSGIAPVYGTVKFSQSATGGMTTLVINLKGFNPSHEVTKHGFHVHENGDLSRSCDAAGAHYNPENKEHGAPEDANRHVGDLGNVNVSTSGEVNNVIKDSIVSLVGKHSVLNKAIVVHETFDDLGLGNFSDSKTTGHAGRRFGCCIILSDQHSNANRRWSSVSSSVVGPLALLARGLV